MATKPKLMTANLTDGVAVANTIRANSSLSYQDRVPEVTRDNFSDIANPILNYTAIQNEFLNNLVNVISRIIVTSKMYRNPWARFKKGKLEYGETIEEVFVNIAKAHQYDINTAQTDVFKIEDADVYAAFHRLNYKNFYKVTISNEELRQAFFAPQGLINLIDRIVDSLYSGAQYDEFTIMKQLINNAITSGWMYPVTVSALASDTAKAFVSTVKGMSNSLTFMNGKYNPMGVANYTDKRRQILILNANSDAIIDVDVLASAFNMDKAEFMGQRVIVDEFENSNVVGVLVDEDFFQIYDQWEGFTENYNGQGLYWNYFYHVRKIFSTSPFANAVVFTTSANTLTGVTVAPTSPTVSHGDTQVFTATVAGTGIIPQGVTWSVNSDLSYITNGGKLYVHPDETESSLTVTATSTVDSTKSGTATVTIS